jgi:superfamily I DNA/RNA helicase
VRVGGDFKEPKPDTDPEEEELMLAYVTVTRAKLRLDVGSLCWIDKYQPRVTEPEPDRRLHLVKNVS